MYINGSDIDGKDCPDYIEHCDCTDCYTEMENVPECIR